MDDKLYVEFTPITRNAVRKSLQATGKQYLGVHQTSDGKTYYVVAAPSTADLVNQIAQLEVALNSLKAKQ